jgi:hypothetical protein
VRPCGWTESSRCFDRLPGVLILELHRAEIAEGRVLSRITLSDGLVIAALDGLPSSASGLL